jgi:hypothetical protein
LTFCIFPSAKKRKKKMQIYLKKKKKKVEEEEGRRRRRSNSAARETLYNPSRALCTYTEEEEGERKEEFVGPQSVTGKGNPIADDFSASAPARYTPRPTDLISRSGDDVITVRHTHTHAGMIMMMVMQFRPCFIALQRQRSDDK